MKDSARDLLTLTVILYFFDNLKYLDLKEHHNTAYCMSLLAYNEKGLRKLIDCFENYREKLSDQFIMECF